jgi:hypothetical protein
LSEKVVAFGVGFVVRAKSNRKSDMDASICRASKRALFVCSRVMSMPS